MHGISTTIIPQVLSTEKYIVTDTIKSDPQCTCFIYRSYSKVMGLRGPRLVVI